eukprot:1464719-Amphidinium_carterae.3
MTVHATAGGECVNPSIHAPGVPHDCKSGCQWRPNGDIDAEPGPQDSKNATEDIRSHRMRDPDQVRAKSPHGDRQRRSHSPAAAGGKQSSRSPAEASSE